MYKYNLTLMLMIKPLDIKKPENIKELWVLRPFHLRFSWIELIQMKGQKLLTY